MTRGSTATFDAPRRNIDAPEAPHPRPRRAGPARYRHPGDILRVVTGLAVLAWLSVVAAGGALTGPERDAFRL